MRYRSFVAACLAAGSFGRRLRTAPSRTTPTMLPATPNLLIGSGIPNIGFVTDAQNNAQTGLGAIYRFLERTGLHRRAVRRRAGPQRLPPAGVAKWDYLLSANLDIDGTSGRNLGNTDVFLTIDWDRRLGLRSGGCTAGTRRHTTVVACGRPPADGSQSIVQRQVWTPAGARRRRASSSSLIQDSQNLAFFVLDGSLFLSVAGSTARRSRSIPFATGAMTSRCGSDARPGPVVLEVSAAVVDPDAGLGGPAEPGGLLLAARRRR